MEEGEERLKELEDGENSQTAVFWTGHGCCSHELTAAVVTCTRFAHDGVHQHSSTDRGGMGEAPLWAEEPLARDGCWGGGIIFLQW